MNLEKAEARGEKKFRVPNKVKKFNRKDVFDAPGKKIQTKHHTFQDEEDELRDVERQYGIHIR